jgi:hypothetical protein
MTGAGFAYVRLAVERGAAGNVREALAARWGLFAPQIGDSSESLVAIVRGEGVPDGMTVESTEQLTATVRPTTTDPLPADDGVYALRWFEIDPSDWDEFLALSEGAWPGFEAANPGVRIHGFFRAGADGERVLLVTRYPSLASWETSRNVDEDGGRANFRRRHELTRSTIVRTYRLIA